MPRYEYKLVPAPEKATKHKGLKGAANFAATLEDVMNALGAEGWSYLRADILPEEVRTGLTSRSTTYRSILVFQRALPDAAHDAARREKPPAAPLSGPRDEDPEEPEDDPSLANLFLLTDDDADKPVAGPARKDGKP
jgi:hypothetical protein